MLLSEEEQKILQLYYSVNSSNWILAEQLETSLKTNINWSLISSLDNNYACGTTHKTTNSFSIACGIKNMVLSSLKIIPSYKKPSDIYYLIEIINLLKLNRISISIKKICL